MDEKRRIHESTKAEYTTEQNIINTKTDGYIDENLKQMQRIEGGGPPNRVNINSLPGPLRFFYYFLIAVAVLMVISMIVVWVIF